MDSKKTSALISAACQMGCIVGGADDEVITLAGEYAEKSVLLFRLSMTFSTLKVMPSFLVSRLEATAK